MPLPREVAADFIKKAESDGVSADEIRIHLQNLGGVEPSREETEEARRPSKLESAGRGVLQGGSLGFADEITAAGESLFTDKTYDQALKESRENYRAAREENPLTYGAGEIGGAVGAAFIPGAGLLNAGKAATVAGKVGRAAFQGGISGLGYSEADDAAGLAKDTIVGSGVGAALGGAASGLSGLSTKLVGKGAEAVDDALVPIGGELTASGRAVGNAAKRLDIVPTKAMVNDDFITKGLEQSLAVSPSAGGSLVRGAQDRAMSGIKRAASQMLEGRADNTAAEIGESVIDSIKTKLLDRYKPIQQAYDEIARSTTNIALKDKSKQAVARNMADYANEAFAPGTPQRAMMNELANRLNGATSVDQLKQIRTSLNRQLQSIDPRLRNGFGPIFQKLDRLEKNSILRAAVESVGGNAEGKALAKGLIGQAKETNKAYRDLMGVVSQLGERSKVSRSRTLTELVRDLDDISPEQIGAKLFRANDQRLLGIVQKEFPEAFDQLRVQKMGEIYSKSLTEGVFSPKKFINEVEKIQPEVRQMIFGNKLSNYEDLKTVVRAFPGAINPSGTSVNMSFGNIFNLPFQAQEAARYFGYKTGAAPKIGVTASAGSRISPYLIGPATDGLIGNQKKLKGPERGER
jgi:hypothetical protein